MSVYKYAVLYEDVAHKSFISCFMSYFASGINPDVRIEEVEDFRIRAKNKKEVDKHCASAYKTAVVHHKVSFFVVCRDMDSIDPKTIEKKKDELREKLRYTENENIVFCFPVQCIEHWLLYLKNHKENPTSTKNEKLENTPRRGAKIQVYGVLKPGVKCADMVSGYCQDIDIGWLESRSESFREFSTNVRRVLQPIIE